jgi:deoxyribodipyrimidine photo-lyase
VIPLYVLDTSPERRPFGGASRWWFDKSLRAHEAALKALGSGLVLRRGPAIECVLAMADNGAPGRALDQRRRTLGS